MASEGPNSPSSVVNSGSGLSWTSPGNATSSNGADSTAETESDTTKKLLATDFGFSIPTGATIDGIVVEVEQASDEGCVDDVASIVKGGVLVGTDKAKPGNWPASDTYVSYGTYQTDLWGVTWIDSHINASDFGFAISVDLGGDPAKAYVDHIRITVHYTTASKGTGNPPVYGPVSGGPTKKVVVVGP